MNQVPRIHGGPDALGAPLYDFSTNSNACGPCPQALAAVQAADATRYPDAGYTAVRAALAAFHGVEAWRIALAGSASEFIFRITAWAVRQGARSVCLPTHAYGDYAHAAQAWSLPVVADANAATLVWACEPSSPLGQAHSPALASLRGTVVLDSAYAPLRLEGQPSLGASQRQQLWQLFSPNKALGLTGVRAAYAIAPLEAQAAVQQLEFLAPSWVLGAHGVALLMAWTQADTQAWLQASLQTLAAWKQRQTSLLHAAGWILQASDTPFFCARPPLDVDTVALCATLRAQGIKLRDATSFGLPGWVRLGVLPPAAQDHLLSILNR
ncbi:aminotransferase class I/II-fold pyridoxal phosphate-dependent enzyme [Rhodoferax saidenbachensis]|uniref:histidinol-phosphate transaminase n=1 Tax=Rhodoferax saidenbachensis TaxID=1484693 RepID=A0ABU1ZIL8_9BURK|nr:aminotransferase class I/II-fold pyridoxal phosphate-dependent enzyme [Rhodoferax saidenbachensis]MDR7305333.1 histidinol-phosphate aminotransferase [Rhodoferax saidenbachensis]